MNARTANSQLSFQLPSMSYIDAKWEEPNLRELPKLERRRGGLVAWLVGRLAAFNAWRQERQALAELESMTDRELLDIGLSRSDLGRVFNPAYNVDLRARGLDA